ncbi:MAG: UDP-3-O-acyl-N-acetylglucosamine deacetylase [Moraxella osloensis]
MQQRTIQQPINLEGIGLHSGNPVHLRFSPAPIDYGIQFYVAMWHRQSPFPLSIMQ